MRSWSTRELALSVSLSVGETHRAIGRCRAAGLVTNVKGDVRIVTKKFLDFLVFGVPVAFYAERGPVSRGVPTGAFAPPLSNKLTVDLSDIPLVWPSQDGKVRGETLQPLYPTAAKAALADPDLYEMLVLVDGLRVGRARERSLAADMLKKRIFAIPEVVEAAS